MKDFSPFVISYMDGPRQGRCAAELHVEGVRLLETLPLARGDVVAVGHADEGKGDVAAGLVYIVSSNADGRVETKLLGRITPPAGMSVLRFRQLKSLWGANQVVLVLGFSDKPVNGKGEAQTWMIDPDRAVPLQEIKIAYAGKTWPELYPTAAGNLVIDNPEPEPRVDSGRENGKPAVAGGRQLLLANGTTGTVRALKILSPKTWARQVGGAALITVRTSDGPLLLDLRTETFIPMQVEGEQPPEFHALVDNALFFVGVDRLAANSTCPSYVLFRLKHPYTGKPEVVVNEISRPDAVTFERTDGRVLVARRPRTPLLDLLQRPTPPEHTDASDEAESDEECPALGDAWLPETQVDLASYDARADALKELGCRQNAEFGLGFQDYGAAAIQFPCASYEDVKKRLAAARVPQLRQCAPLRDRIQHCLAALRLDDFDALSVCHGDVRYPPDFGSATYGFLGRQLLARVWALRHLDGKRAPAIERQADEATAVFKTKDGTALVMQFRKEGCEWPLAGTAVRPAEQPRK